MTDAAVKKPVELAADMPAPIPAPPAPPLPPLLTREQQANLVRSNDLTSAFSMEVLRELMNDGIKVPTKERIGRQPETVDHAIAQLYQAADVSNTGAIRGVKNTPEAEREKIDAPFKSLLKAIKYPPTDQNATQLTQIVLEAADTYPRETSGNLPLTDNVLYPINSGFVAVAAFKERTVDKKCAKANVPTTADATLKQRLSDMFIHNAATKDGDTYSSKVTLAGGKDIGYDLGDRYCQDRGRLPATATTKKIIAKQ